MPQLIKNMSEPLGKRLAERVNLRWLNVAANELEPFFQWSESKSFASVDS
jgi:hypothetical protein